MVDIVDQWDSEDHAKALELYEKTVIEPLERKVFQSPESDKPFGDKVRTKTDPYVNSGIRKNREIRNVGKARMPINPKSVLRKARRNARKRETLVIEAMLAENAERIARRDLQTSLMTSQHSDRHDSEYLSERDCECH